MQFVLLLTIFLTSSTFLGRLPCQQRRPLQLRQTSRWRVVPPLEPQSECSDLVRGLFVGRAC
jgi:hypothetical protein